MNIDFKLPELGENIHSGDVVNVLVQEGDVIEANDGLVELETDKAVVEIPCPHAGRIAKLLVKKGDTVKVGQALATITSGETAEPAATEPVPAATAAPAPESAKAKASGGKEPDGAIAAAVAAPAVLDRPGPIPAGPAVRRMAREQGVDLRTVAGSGKYGRITPEDLRTASPSAAAAAPSTAAVSPAPAAPAVSPSSPAPAPVAPAAEPAPPASASQPAPVTSESTADAWGPVRVEKLSRIRRTIAEQMTRAASTIPHVTNFDDADVTELERLRQGVPAGQLGQNIKLTMMPFVMKAVAMVLRRHAALNAVFDEQNEQIVYKEYVNLGIAVDTPRGLVVPNVRNADRLTILQLAQALGSIAERARGAQFGIDDLRGGTFTISNLGAVGGAYSTPIINYPEVAILLLGRARWLPVVRGENHDRIETRLMMPLSLSYDHRLVDGATAGRFLNEVIRNLETPGMLLLA
jgi:pyruvate/2-oxoglutarate dehydrogenase complex dihydrolipoamide acyltransferase (E2) component